MKTEFWYWMTEHCFSLFLSVWIIWFNIMLLLFIIKYYFIILLCKLWKKCNTTFSISLPWSIWINCCINVLFSLQDNSVLCITLLKMHHLFMCSPKALLIIKTLVHQREVSYCFHLSSQVCIHGLIILLNMQIHCYRRL